ncbi:hypothetical protein BN9982_310029 [Mycobacterium tuberculosis]|nr:hypothetical protein BN9982_310029 [Mycobacterium tuberculosis]
MSHGAQWVSAHDLCGTGRLP